MARTYLDHASAWPLREEAERALADALPVGWSDPARSHREGRDARELLDRATATAARRLAAPERGVVWTGSGTEAIHLATVGTLRAAVRRGDDRRHMVASAVEHSAVLAVCERLRRDHGVELTTVEVDASGRVDAGAVADAVRDDTLLVHLQHANHEVGTLQPTHDVAALCRERGVALHVDACQTVGQLGVTLAQVGADLLTASAAKFGGPRGVGLLAVGDRGRADALLEGDDHQRGRRAGMPAVPEIAAAAVALEVAADRLDSERSSREVVRRHLRSRLPEVLDDVAVHGPLADAHPGIVAFSVLYVDGAALVDELDTAGFAVHSGSSCASEAGEPSHVLAAMGALTHGHVRVGIGPETTTEDAERLLDALAEIVPRLRSARGAPGEPRSAAATGRA